MPPNDGYDGTGRVSDGIKPIGRGVSHEMGPSELAEEAPYNQVKADFTERGSSIMIAPAETTLSPEDEGEGGGDEEEVIKMTG